jgi:alanyl-tRNA synthetase
MTPEQIEEVEKLVNEKIDEDLPVVRLVMKKTEAEELGAQMEFGVKYAETVTVYSIGPVGATEEDPKLSETFSLEFCGGPHASHTLELREGDKKKVFKIQKEEAVSAGVRRIKGILV